jgi:lysophospholipase L1-like esterase
MGVVDMADHGKRSQRPVRNAPRLPHWFTPTLGLCLVVVLALTAIMGSALLATHAQHKQYYVGLGDSLTFGIQPDFNWNSSFYLQTLAALKAGAVSGATPLTVNAGINFACPGETPLSMDQDRCPKGRLCKSECPGPQTMSQSDEAVQFLRAHQGAVRLITLDIGASALETDIDDGKHHTGPCTRAANKDPVHDLSDVRTYVPKILRKLLDAGASAQNLYVLDYYNPFAYNCTVPSTNAPDLSSVGCASPATPQPDARTYVECMNTVIRDAVSQAGLLPNFVDIYAAFGGAQGMADSVARYTWMPEQGRLHDFHPNTQGYSVMAHAVEAAVSDQPSSRPIKLLFPWSAVGGWFRERWEHLA